MTASPFLLLLAFLAAIGGGLYLGLGAQTTSLACVANGCVTSQSTMADDEGLLVLLPLLAPALVPITLFTLSERRARKEIKWAISGVALAACLIAIFSVGAFYLPAAVLCLAAVAFEEREARQPS